MIRRLYFELSAYDRYHRADWEDRLGRWLEGTRDRVARVDRPDDADFIIEPAQTQSFVNGRVFTVAPESHYHRRPESTFAWDQGDHPTGRLPGLFCSLRRQLAQPDRHRGFCYPLRMNRLVRECPRDEARYLFGFSGNVTAPIRSRIFRELAGADASGRALLRQTESLFTRIYSPETDFERNRYVDDLRQCRFILCPRGNGLSSIRLFETMEAGRVPVILSDALLLPQCVRWETCAVIVAESDVARLPEILSALEPDWARRAANARSEWLRCFGDSTLLPMLVDQLLAIQAARTRPESHQRFLHPGRAFPHYAVAQAKGWVRRLQTLRRTFA